MQGMASLIEKFTETYKSVEEKSKQLQDEMQKQVSYFNELGNAIKKLRNDRKITQANISKIDGAIQAYSESIRLLKDGVCLDKNQNGEIRENV